MGAWDYGFFDNDAALDCVDALERSAATSSKSLCEAIRTTNGKTWVGNVSCDVNFLGITVHSLTGYLNRV